MAEPKVIKELNTDQFASSRDQLHERDYVSPGMAVVKLDPCFPSMLQGNFDNIKNPLFRKHITHTWYVDPSWPECGFLTRDEAHILYNNALLFPNKPALEIGSHVGWSTVHLAVAGVRLDVIEPMLKHDLRVLMAIIQSLRIAQVNDRVNLVAGFSPAEVITLAERDKRRWNLMFIDGNHNGDYPLNDAKICEKYAAEDAMILFHDLAFPDVAAGFKYLHDQAWKTKIYHTQQIMGVAWRGAVTPVNHTPDPRYNWEAPEHLNWHSDTKLQ